LDFRCYTSEGIALFTALQYMGVKSRLIYFPNEGHWVLEPADSAVWYHEVVGWLMSMICEK
jgi:dipeptidyl aminopeptidase/acylaminoacyl peptidase